MQGVSSWLYLDHLFLRTVLHWSRGLGQETAFPGEKGDEWVLLLGACAHWLAHLEPTVPTALGTEHHQAPSCFWETPATSRQRADPRKG